MKYQSYAGETEHPLRKWLKEHRMSLGKFADKLSFLGLITTETQIQHIFTRQSKSKRMFLKIAEATNNEVSFEMLEDYWKTTP